jgi:hypothetical protein
VDSVSSSQNNGQFGPSSISDIANIFAQLAKKLEQQPPPDFDKKPDTYATGTDPTAEFFGKNPSVDVYVATEENPISSLGSLLANLQGKSIPISPKEKQADAQAAQQILGQFDHDNTQIAQWFGQNKIHFNAYISPGSSGASHLMPQPGEPQHYEDNITIQVSSDPKLPPHPSQATEFMDAEAIESYEDRTNNWNAGLTNGESLSRAMAFELQPKAASDPGLSTGPMQAWWASGHKDYINGNPDFIPDNQMNKQGFQHDGLGGLQTRTQASDMNEYANGAGTLFLMYLHDKLGYSWTQIIQAKGETLGEKYQSLTGKSGKEGFEDFIHALPTKTDANGETILDLPPDGNPFKPR